MKRAKFKQKNPNKPHIFKEYIGYYTFECHLSSDIPFNDRLNIFKASNYVRKLNDGIKAAQTQ